MKTRNILISLAALLPLASCDLVELGGPHDEGGSSVTINVGPADVQTRSSVGSTDSELTAFENKIVDLTLFRYAVSGSSETLESATYYDLSSGSGTTRTITVSGKEGTTYKFYGLLNCGDKSSAVSVGSAPSALQNITITGLDLSSMQTDGIPMVNRDGVSITFGTTTSAKIPMTRMVARWDFKLDTSGLTHTTFTITSLKLCQSPNRTSPFASSNAFQSSSYVQDGDAATSSDISSLSSGSAISYYVLENACGNLLPSNTDPWSKVPSSGTSVSGYYPTYIEIYGILKDNSGLFERDSYYRMYLGENTTTNFDVERGTKYTLTFKPTEDPITDDIDDEWKCECDDQTDSRNFSFEEDVYFVPQGGNTTFGVKNDLDAYGITYKLSSELSTVSITGSTKKLSNSSSGTWTKGTLTAYYWDGKVADQCTVISGGKNQSPVGLYIYDNTTSTDASSPTYIHDPNCPINHWVHDDENCPYMHYAIYDAGDDDYYSLDQCPYWHSDEDECQNKILDYSGAINGESAIFARLVTDFYYDDSGIFKFDYHSNASSAVKKVQLGTFNDSDYWGYWASTSTGVTNTCNITVSNVGIYSCFQWACQFQDPLCQYWTVDIYNGSFTNTYKMSIWTKGLVRSVDSEPSFGYSITSNSVYKVDADSDTGVPSSKFYLFCSKGYLVNMSDVSKGNVVQAGDTFRYFKDSEKTGLPRTTVLNSDGSVVTMF